MTTEHELFNLKSRLVSAKEKLILMTEGSLSRNHLQDIEKLIVHCKNFFYSVLQKCKEAQAENQPVEILRSLVHRNFSILHQLEELIVKIEFYDSDTSLATTVLVTFEDESEVSSS